MQILPVGSSPTYLGNWVALVCYLVKDKCPYEMVYHSIQWLTGMFKCDRWTDHMWQRVLQ